MLDGDGLLEVAGLLDAAGVLDVSCVLDAAGLPDAACPPDAPWLPDKGGRKLGCALHCVPAKVVAENIANMQRAVCERLTARDFKREYYR